MEDIALSPILDSGAGDRSALIGAPDNFDFLTSLKEAHAIKLAVAFGHMSGWAQIENALRSCHASLVQVLLGQAFFQTEPELIAVLNAFQKQSGHPEIEVKLAAASSTFHPKVWIVELPKICFGIVGSGNLSRGGLLSNVECSLYTSRPAEVSALRDWFQVHWAAAPDFDKAFERYKADYAFLKQQRLVIDAKIDAAMQAQADREATWQRRLAIELSGAYFKSAHGMAEVQSRVSAIERMRALLHYPTFDFSASEWKQFLRIPELGRIRLGHEQKTLNALPALISILHKLPKFRSAGSAVEALQAQPGIGRNLATKLLAVYDPERNIVVNEPVQAALLAFSYADELELNMTGTSYERFLRDLAPFVEECQAAGLPTAPALDAFFYDYRKGMPTSVSIAATGK